MVQIKGLTDADNRELEKVVAVLRRSKGFKHAAKQLALFNHLLENCNNKSKAETILGQTLEEHGVASVKVTRSLVWQLRQALSSYFADVQKGWVIALPQAGRGQGWQLEFSKRRNDDTFTWRFWNAHVDDGLEIYIVYASRLFYRALDNKHPFVFRYYDCNTESADQAKALLKQHHPDMFEAHEQQLSPVFPYVPWGELVARDQIKNWFSKYAGIDVQMFNPHRMRAGHSLWEESLILLGSTSGNAMIEKLFNMYPNLPIKMGGTEGISDVVIIPAPTSTEIKRINAARVNKKSNKSNVTLATTAEEDCVLAVITRVPSPYHQGPITVLNSGFGAALEQLAELVTNDEKMKNFFNSVPRYFQTVFTASIADSDARPLMKLLAIRVLDDSHLTSN